MSYGSIADMAKSASLLARIAACAASQSIPNPLQWASGHMWEIVAQPGWGEKWQYAVDNVTLNANPDFGARDDVISDPDILTAVQALNKGN